MKTVKRILLLIFILLGGALFSTYAGSKGEIKGMLITASYDTLNGYIKKVPDKKLFISLKFRTSPENAYTDYRPEQVEAFISDEISLFSHRICLNNVSRYIFIKKIYEGKIDLYYSWLAYNSDLIINGNDLYFAGFDDGKRRCRAGGGDEFSAVDFF